MSKTKSLVQQRATFRSEPTGSFGLEEDTYKKNTLLLAQFLSTTGPEEYLKPNKRPINSTPRVFFSKLRKRTSVEKPKLVEISQRGLRDSGVYSDTSDKDFFMSINDFQFPQPPVSKPASHSPIYSPKHRSNPENHRKTSKTQVPATCPHCHQNLKIRARRASSPPALASGKKVEHDSRSLLAMIQQLKIQLAEEKRCRVTLEKAVYKRQQRQSKESVELSDSNKSLTLLSN
ncbi:unnamed protein product [Rhizopus stolonifer]